MTDFSYTPLFQKGPDSTSYRHIGREGVDSVEWEGESFLRVRPQALIELSRQAFIDVAHFLRSAHLESLAHILKDPEASDNDHIVARELLQNAIIAAEGVFPGCQDTGTACIMGVRGDHVLVSGDDAEHLSQGVFRAYRERNLRYSQVAPLTMYEEKNTGNNLPAQIDLFAGKGDSYHFMFVAKGGGSANKFSLYQQTKALLRPTALQEFIWQAIHKLGTAACPPYHLSIVIGGLSAEMTMKSVKLLSTGYYDTLPTSGDRSGRAFRDPELEKEVLVMTQNTGIGAQFGGKYFCHDVRILRLPRHGASCPVGVGVSCSADRNILGRIDRDGLWLEELERSPARLLPEVSKAPDKGGIRIDLNQDMQAILADLGKLKVGDVVHLNGPMIVARDIAHAKIRQVLETTGDLPDYFKKHPVYYAGPAKTPKGHPSGSFGPTTAQRMDPYVTIFQPHGASMVMLAKGNRGEEVAQSCAQHGGFYLGSAGGPAARLGRDCIKKVEVIDYPELGMEAVHRIEVEDFPAFIVVDHKGNDFYARFRSPASLVSLARNKGSSS
jgi:fumarate hydratase, class I